MQLSEFQTRLSFSDFHVAACTVRTSPDDFSHDPIGSPPIRSHGSHSACSVKASHRPLLCRTYGVGRCVGKEPHAIASLSHQFSVCASAWHSTLTRSRSDKARPPAAMCGCRRNTSELVQCPSRNDMHMRLFVALRVAAVLSELAAHPGLHMGVSRACL